MITTTTRKVVDYAIKGQSAKSHGALKTVSTPNGIRHGGYTTGMLPFELTKRMQERADSIVQVIYSYSTPIAWLDAGAWVIVSQKYSVTTSKHQGTLYKLTAKIYVDWTTTHERYMRALNGLSDTIQMTGE